MITELGDELFADFEPAKGPVDPIIVKRFLPDNSMVEIGRIYQDFTDTENTGSVTFISTDTKGDKLFPPTTDYPEVEHQFERYAKQLTVKAIAEESETKAQKISERVSKMQELRRNKKRVLKNIHL